MSIRPSNPAVHSIIDQLESLARQPPRPVERIEDEQSEDWPCSAKSNEMQYIPLDGTSEGGLSRFYGSPCCWGWWCSSNRYNEYLSWDRARPCSTAALVWHTSLRRGLKVAYDWNSRSCWREYLGYSLNHGKGNLFGMGGCSAVSNGCEDVPRQTKICADLSASVGHLSIQILMLASLRPWSCSRMQRLPPPFVVCLLCKVSTIHGTEDQGHEARTMRVLNDLSYRG